MVLDNNRAENLISVYGDNMSVGITDANFTTKRNSTSKFYLFAANNSTAVIATTMTNKHFRIPEHLHVSSIANVEMGLDCQASVTL